MKLFYAFHYLDGLNTTTGEYGNTQNAGAVVAYATKTDRDNACNSLKSSHFDGAKKHNPVRAVTRKEIIAMGHGDVLRDGHARDLMLGSIICDTIDKSSTPAQIECYAENRGYRIDWAYSKVSKYQFDANTNPGVYLHEFCFTDRASLVCSLLVREGDIGQGLEQR
jgi:hypothetical protein